MTSSKKINGSWPAWLQEVIAASTDNKQVIKPLSGPVYVAGLNSIRFACAMLVVLDHVHPPSITPWPTISKMVELFFWGQPAVIIFFIISGFCIHYPQANGDGSLNVVPFVVRRLVRIGLPIVVLCLALRATGIDLLVVDGGVLWSLYCEIAYYIAYPVLFYLAQKANWAWLLSIALVVSLLEMIRKPHAAAYYHHGFWGMILLGLPIWLMGCILAEWLVRSDRSAQVTGILPWRVGMFAGGTFLNFLNFHAGIGYSWTLWIYALVAMMWLRLEVIRAQNVGMPKFLETAGLASYSIYICHLPLVALGMRAGFENRLVLILGCLLGSAVFYLTVESPCLKLARILGRWFERGAWMGKNFPQLSVSYNGNGRTP